MNFESQVYFRQPAEKSTEGDQYFYELKAMGKGGKDDVIVTESGGVVIGGDKKIPVTVEELEAVVGK